MFIYFYFLVELCLMCLCLSNSSLFQLYRKSQKKKKRVTRKWDLACLMIRFFFTIWSIFAVVPLALLGYCCYTFCYFKIRPSISYFILSFFLSQFYLNIYVLLIIVCACLTMFLEFDNGYN
jgi:uncharacterized membrane protein